MKKKLLLIFFMLVSAFFTNQVHAELFDESIHFYIKSGEDLSAKTNINIVYFCKDGKLHIKTLTKYEIGKNLQQDRNYYNSNKAKSWSCWAGKYQPSISTSSKDVYGGGTYDQHYNPYSYMPGQPDFINTKNGYQYFGFSKDKSSYISWREDLDGNITSKVYYIEIKREDLLPKTINRDFLYD